MKNLFKTDYLECFIDEDSLVLFHAWLRKPTSKEFREGLTNVSNEFVKHKNDKKVLLNWLGDTLKVGVLSIEDQGWLDRVWNEMLFVKAGVKTHAVIVGNDVFAKYAMEKWKNNMIKKYTGQNLHLETFVDKVAAYKWFKSIDNKPNL